MKILLFVFSIILVFCGTATTAHAEQNIFYAQINAECVLFSDDDLSIAVTSLPETYFVTVLSSEFGVAHVSYGNLTGYVDEKKVTAVDFTPRYKFACSTLSLVNDGGVINVRSRPDHTQSNVLVKLTDGTSADYYGTVTGTVQNDIIGDKWYALKLPDGKIGYVYSMYALAKPFPPNVVEAEPEPKQSEVQSETFISERSGYFLIAALCLPVIVFMYVLFKSPNEKHA